MCSPWRLLSFLSLLSVKDWGPKCHFKAVLLNLDTVDVLDEEFFLLRSCPVYCRMFSTFLATYPLDATNTPQL